MGDVLNWLTSIGSICSIVALFGGAALWMLARQRKKKKKAEADFRYTMEELRKSSSTVYKRTDLGFYMVDWLSCARHADLITYIVLAVFIFLFLLLGVSHNVYLNQAMLSEEITISETDVLVYYAVRLLMIILIIRAIFISRGARVFLDKLEDEFNRMWKETLDKHAEEADKKTQPEQSP